jgi:hypothetical protein
MPGNRQNSLADTILGLCNQQDKALSPKRHSKNMELMLPIKQLTNQAVSIKSDLFTPLMPLDLLA